MSERLWIPSEDFLDTPSPRTWDNATSTWDITGVSKYMRLKHRHQKTSQVKPGLSQFPDFCNTVSIPSSRKPSRFHTSFHTIWHSYRYLLCIPLSAWPCSTSVRHVRSRTTAWVLPLFFLILIVKPIMQWNLSAVKQNLHTFCLHSIVFTYVSHSHMQVYLHTATEIRTWKSAW